LIVLLMAMNYDLDFCRSAQQAGLRLGVWPLDLIHASGGGAFPPTWRAHLLPYQMKWNRSIPLLTAKLYCTTPMPSPVPTNS
jgi:hypothetical protein